MKLKSTKFKTLLLCFIFGLLPVSGMAGSGHGHSHSYTPVNQEVAKINATKIIEALVKRNKLDDSWASVTASSVEKKVFKGNPEWLAIFINEKAKDADKQKLYVFLTLGGDYIAANFTGE